MKDFVPMLAEHADVDDRELLENDVRLHLLLEALFSDDRAGDRLLFKGGTCLIKCHLDYPRFSTDLDFTWHHPDDWLEMGTNELRRTVRPLQRDLVDAIREHVSAQGLPAEDGDSFEVQYGQSNKVLTVVILYETETGISRMLKLTFNFLEPLRYEPETVEARSLLGGGVPDALKVLDSETADRYAAPVPVHAYDPREILAEKGRAILTREATKVRDVLDLYLLEDRLDLPVEDHADDIQAKTQHAVERADRYARELERADERFPALLEDDPGPLLLEEIDREAFDKHRRRAVDTLRGIRDRIDNE